MSSSQYKLLNNFYSFFYQLKGLAEYMKHLGYEDANRIEEYTVVLEKMKWRSNNDYTNCGVYIMKHMETFTADPNESWICDLKPNNVRVINDQLFKI